jgi:hypothetical protein
MIELQLPCGFDTLEYSLVKATIGICTLTDYSVAKKHQQSSEFGYGYFCGNVFSEDFACVSSHREISKYPFYLSIITLNMSLSTTKKVLRLGGV